MAVPVIIVRILCDTAQGGRPMNIHEQRATSTKATQRWDAGSNLQGLFQRAQSVAMLTAIQFHSKWRGGSGNGSDLP